jgi:hypothetical protein
MRWDGKTDVVEITDLLSFVGVSSRRRGRARTRYADPAYRRSFMARAAERARSQTLILPDWELAVNASAPAAPARPRSQLQRRLTNATWIGPAGRPACLRYKIRCPHW